MRPNLAIASLPFAACPMIPRSQTRPPSSSASEVRMRTWPGDHQFFESNQTQTLRYDFGNSGWPIEMSSRAITLEGGIGIELGNKFRRTTIASGIVKRPSENPITNHRPRRDGLVLGPGEDSMAVQTDAICGRDFTSISLATSPAYSSPASSQSIREEICEDRKIVGSPLPGCVPPPTRYTFSVNGSLF